MLLSASYGACIISCGLQLRSRGGGSRQLRASTIVGIPEQPAHQRATTLEGRGGGEPANCVGAVEVSASPQMIHLHLQLIMQLMTHVNNTVTH